MLFLNGEFLEIESAKISVLDHGFLYGDGVYETILVFEKRICFWKEHITRLHSSLSAVLLSLPPQYTEKKLYEIATQLIDRNNCDNGRLRISVSRGENHFDFLSCNHPTIMFSLSPLSLPTEKMLQEGVKTCIFHCHRVAPLVKSINFLPGILAKQHAARHNCFEAIFVTENGFLREGSVSNIFFVQKLEKKIWIPPQETVLAGTALHFFLSQMQKNGFEIQEKQMKYNDIPEDFSAFLSNSLFGILPITSIENKIFPIENSFCRFFWEYLLNKS